MWCTTCAVCNSDTLTFEAVISQVLMLQFPFWHEQINCTSAAVDRDDALRRSHWTTVTSPPTEGGIRLLPTRLMKELVQSCRSQLILYSFRPYANKFLSIKPCFQNDSFKRVCPLGFTLRLGSVSILENGHGTGLETDRLCLSQNRSLSLSPALKNPDSSFSTIMDDSFLLKVLSEIESPSTAAVQCFLFESIA